MEGHCANEVLIIKPRYQANARERDRTQNVNTAFVVLRSIIPTEPMDRKLSKIETIRLATKYISHLEAAIATDIQINPCAALQDRSDRRTQRNNTFCTFCISDYKHFVNSTNITW